MDLASSTPALVVDKDPLNRLARELALNYLDTSLSNEELFGGGRKDRIRETFQDEMLVNEALEGC